MTENHSPVISKGVSLEEEASLIESARDDPSAFTRLYQAYVRPIYRYIYSRVVNAGEAEDLTAQVFMEALAGLPRYRHKGHFPAWLFSIARHKVADYFRYERLEFPLETASGQSTSGKDPLSTLIQSEDIRFLADQINRLGEQDQELLRLRFVAELGFAEIAILLNRNLDATKKRLYRLLVQLKQKLEVDHD